METQQLIKLLGTASALACIAFGIVALFRGIRADGEVDISALFKGKIKTGSAGVLLLFFGVALFAVIVLKGYTSESIQETQRRRMPKVSVPAPQDPKSSAGISTPAPIEQQKTEIDEFEKKTEMHKVQTAYAKPKKPWWKFW